MRPSPPTGGSQNTTRDTPDPTSGPATTPSTCHRARSERPFFIVGNPRSGTTLLRFLLSSHSRIYIPEETGFVPHLVPYVGRSMTPQEVAKLVRRIGRMNHEWADMVPDDAAFYHQLDSPDLPHVLDALYRLRIAPQGAERWGDKGPSYVRWIPQLERIFPDALYIHMVRDGRDCALSAMRKWGDRSWYFDAYYLMQNWARNIRAGRSAGRFLGEQRYLEVRYEQLVTEPTSTVEQICEYLGERFEPTMLDHTGLARELVPRSGHYEVQEPVSTRSIGNWRKMEIFDQKVANRVAGRELHELGYELPNLPSLTVSERLRYARLAARFVGTDNARRLLYAVGWLKMSRAKARDHR